MLVVEREGLSGHWSFEGSGADFGPYQQDVTLVGPVYSSISMHGANSLLLNGVGQYAHVADDETLDIGTNSFAVALWMKRDQNEATNLRVLSKGASSASVPGYCLFGSDSSISAAVSDGVTRKIITGYPEEEGEWMHVVLNITRSDNKMKLYLDGELAGEDVVPSGIIDSTYRLYIGRNATSENLYWDGRIDDVRIYQRSLSESEIRIMAKQLL